MLREWLAKRTFKRIQYEAEMSIYAEEWYKIHPGMSLEKVMEILGPPRKIMPVVGYDVHKLADWWWGRGFIKGAVRVDYEKSGPPGRIVSVELPYICKYYKPSNPCLGWNRLNQELLSRMKKQLGSEFNEFSETCERIGLVSSNFIPINDQISTFSTFDVKLACFLCASAVVSAANHYGSQSNINMARRFAVWALALAPTHIPALMCLANVCQLEGDEQGMSECYQKCEAIKKRLMNTPDSDLEAYEQALLDLLRSG
jgi:hypothetical protein